MSDPFPGTITSPASMHGYSYARNNPTNYIDPTGEFWIAAVLGVAALATLVWGAGNLADMSHEAFIAQDGDVHNMDWNAVASAPQRNGTGQAMAEAVIMFSVGYAMPGGWMGFVADVGLGTLYDWGLQGDSPEEALLYNVVGNFGGEIAGRTLAYGFGRAARRWKLGRHGIDVPHGVAKDLDDVWSRNRQILKEQGGIPIEHFERMQEWRLNQLGDVDDAVQDLAKYAGGGQPYVASFLYVEYVGNIARRNMEVNKALRQHPGNDLFPEVETYIFRNFNAKGVGKPHWYGPTQYNTQGHSEMRSMAQLIDMIGNNPGQANQIILMVDQVMCKHCRGALMYGIEEMNRMGVNSPIRVLWPGQDRVYDLALQETKWVPAKKYDFFARPSLPRIDNLR